jgi:hypothetical protein
MGHSLSARNLDAVVAASAVRRVVVTGFVAALVVAGGAARADAAVKPDAGSYSGSAGAGFPVSFKVGDGGKEITRLRTDFEGTVNCGPASDNPPYFDFPTLSILDDSFKGQTSVLWGSGINPSYTIKGTFSSPTRANGTIHVYFTYPHNALPPCEETDSFSVAKDH